MKILFKSLKKKFQEKISRKKFREKLRKIVQQRKPENYQKVFEEDNGKNLTPTHLFYRAYAFSLGILERVLIDIC